MNSYKILVINTNVGVELAVAKDWIYEHAPSVEFLFVVVPQHVWIEHLKDFGQFFTHRDSVYVGIPPDTKFIVLWQAKKEKTVTYQKLAFHDVITETPWERKLRRGVEKMFDKEDNFLWAYVSLYTKQQNSKQNWKNTKTKRDYELNVTRGVRQKWLFEKICDSSQ